MCHPYEKRSSSKGTAGVTQAETAKGAGIPESAFSEMRAGKRKMAAKHVRGLAKYFGVPADLILSD